MKSLFAIRLLLITCFGFSCASAALAEESILSFHSQIEVLHNGQLQVTETIVINSEGNKIRRGIYRDLPTSYPHPQYGQYGFKSNTPIQIISLQRDRQNEVFHVQKLDNGVRVYFGRKSHLLKNGKHNYIFRYLANRQILVEGEFARLYWNVTGNGWSFPILKASAGIKLPGSAHVYAQEVWTGRQGESKSNARFAGDVSVRATQALKPFEGMTLRIKFDGKDLILDKQSNFETLIADNKSLFSGFLLLAFMLMFFLAAWYFRGRDPERGIIVARYRPVEDLSAAAHRAAFYNRADDTSFAVGVLSAAIKGWLSISKSGSKGFKLSSEGPGSELSPSELLLVNGLFKSRKTVVLGSKYNANVAAVRQSYQKFLKDEFAKKNHENDSIPLFIGGLIGMGGIWMVVIPGIEPLLKFIPFLAMFGFALVVSNKAIRKYTNHSVAYSVSAYAAIIGILALFKGFPFPVIPVLLFAIIFALFTHLMPAPKHAARKMLDQIEGFRLYLAKAEHDSLKRLDIPEKTPQLYEELLPFAVALDLETQWSDQFTEILAAAKLDPKASHGGWYSGGNYSSMSSFVPAVASGLASSVVAASTPPSSSSSGGGGGFSGGGGGGGGGGGW
jgi:hypothetical protein